MLFKKWLCGNPPTVDKRDFHYGKMKFNQSFENTSRIYPLIYMLFQLKHIS